jgi:hypothetical protein
MVHGIELSETKMEATAQQNSSLKISPEETFTALKNEPRANDASLKAQGILPYLNLSDGAAAPANGVERLAKDVARDAGTVAKTAAHGALESIKVLESVPSQDWLQFGKSTAKVFEKDGPSLVLDSVVIAK